MYDLHWFHFHAAVYSGFDKGMYLLIPWVFALACASTVALSLPLSSHVPIPKFRTLQEGIHLLLQFKGSVCPKARKRESVAQRAAEKYENGIIQTI